MHRKIQKTKTYRNDLFVTSTCMVKLRDPGGSKTPNLILTTKSQLKIVRNKMLVLVSVRKSWLQVMPFMVRGLQHVYEPKFPYTQQK